MFTVVWTQVALDHLTTVWLQADSITRQRITEAMALIDRHVRANAPRLGESRSKGVRVLIVEPLGIEFRVSERDRMVTVIRAWTVRQRRS